MPILYIIVIKITKIMIFDNKNINNKMTCYFVFKLTKMGENLSLCLAQFAIVLFNFNF